MAKKKIVHLIVLFLFAGALSQGGAALAQTEGDGIGEASTLQSCESAPPYNAYTMKKPTWYTDLHGLVLAIHSTDPESPRRLLPETIHRRQ